MPGFTPAGKKYAFKTKAEVPMTQNSPVQNTWYTLCDLAGGLEILESAVNQANDEVADKNVESEITIDGIVWNNTTLQGHGYDYFLFSTSTAPMSRHLRYGRRQECPAGVRVVTDADAGLGAVGYLPCHAFKVRVRITDAPGTNQVLRGFVHYIKMEAV